MKVLPTREELPAVISAGWIPLEWWCVLTMTDWLKALAYANPKSQRTGKRFAEADVDRRGRGDVRVWWQPPPPIGGIARPRLVQRPLSPSGAGATRASRSSAQGSASRAHAQAIAGSGPAEAHSVLHEQAGAGA